MSNLIQASCTHSDPLAPWACPSCLADRVDALVRERDALRTDLASVVEALKAFAGEIEAGARTLYHEKAVLARDRDWLLGQAQKARAALSSSILTTAEEWARMQETEIKYRRELWLNHGHSGMYGDDGEMQCIECAPYGTADYKRDPLEIVEKAAMQARMLLALSLTPAPGPTKEE